MCRKTQGFPCPERLEGSHGRFSVRCRERRHRTCHSLLEPSDFAERRSVLSTRRRMMALQIDSVSAEARARREWLRESAEHEDMAPGSPRRISICGLGYVGAVSLACLARDGHEMFGVDIDPGKLELLRRGQAPIVETGIQELTRAVMG